VFHAKFGEGTVLTLEGAGAGDGARQACANGIYFGSVAISGFRQGSVMISLKIFYPKSLVATQPLLTG
jgi:hypothetical protein